MSVNTYVGHSYFGKGKVLDVKDNNAVVDFGYPYGVKTVAVNAVSEIPVTYPTAKTGGFPVQRPA